MAPHQLCIPVLLRCFALLSQKACENQCLGAKQCLSGINSLFGWHLFLKKTNIPTVRSHSVSFHAQVSSPCFSTFCSYSPEISIVLCAFWLGLVITRLGFLLWGQGASILGAGNRSGEWCLSLVFTVHSGEQNLNMFISPCRQGIVDWMQLLITKNFNILN